MRRRDIRRRRPAPTSFIASLTLREKRLQKLFGGPCLWSRGAQHCIWSMNMNDSAGGARCRRWVYACAAFIQVARECGATSTR